MTTRNGIPILRVCCLPSALCLPHSNQHNGLIVARRAPFLKLPHFSEQAGDDLVRGAMGVLAENVLEPP
jgi:hypothetical protein